MYNKVSFQGFSFISLNIDSHFKLNLFIRFSFPPFERRMCFEYLNVYCCRLEMKNMLFRSLFHANFLPLNLSSGTPKYILLNTYHSFVKVEYTAHKSFSGLFIVLLSDGSSENVVHI